MKFKEPGNLKFLIAYLFFLLVTTSRFFLEAHFGRFADPQNLIFHHHYWFLFVFFMFLINFKYILKMPAQKSWWIAFCSPIILMPIFYYMIFGSATRLRLNYISVRELDIYFRDIFTFMVFSQRNQAISGELIVVVIGISAFSYYISRKVIRSIIMGVSSYLCLMIFAGTVLIAPHKPERVLIYAKSALNLQNFMSYIYFFAAFIAGSILFSNELRQFFKERKRKIAFSSLALFFFIVFQLFLKRPQIADRVLMIPHSFLFSLFISVLIFKRKEWMLKAALFVHVLVSSGILYNCWTMPVLKNMRGS